MKKVVLIIAILLLTLTIVPICALAHSGGTDSSGGHHDRSTGEYHYHHGYSAHQHPGGKCPYEDDKDEEPLIIVPIISVTVAYIIFMLSTLEVLDKFGETVQKVFAGILIAAILVSMLCLAAVPGAVLITAAVEGIIYWIIWVIINNHRYKRK